MCIFCKDYVVRQVISENGYKGWRCLNCGLIYCDPQPKEIHYDHPQENYFKKALHARHNLKIIKRYATGRLLEVGCGYGEFLQQANADLYINAYGFDRSGWYPGNTKFNIVYHCNVLSHFKDPIGEFKQMNEILHPGGYMIFETGNLGDINPYRIKTFGLPEHLFFFSTPNIKQLLEVTGFELVKIYRYSFGIQIAASNLIRKKKTTGTGTAKESHIKNIYFMLMHFVTYKLGQILPKRGRPQTMIVIAKKQGMNSLT